MSWLSLCAALPCCVQQELKHRWMPLAASGLLAFAICGFHLAALGTLAVTPDPALAQISIGHQRHHTHHRRGLHHRLHHGRCARRNTPRRAIVPRDRARSSAAARGAATARRRAEPAERALRYGADQSAARADHGGCRSAPGGLQQALCRYVRHSVRADEAGHAHQRAGGPSHRQRHPHARHDAEVFRPKLWAR